MKRFFDLRLLFRAALAGVALQLLLALTAHFSSWMAAYLLQFGQMLFSGVAGCLYGFWIGRTYALGALGGAIAGGLCAAPVIALSALMGDSEPAMVSIGTGISMLAGVAGGAVGHYLALRRKVGM